ncbi:MAG: tRNA pseudouridine(38-40) synthase TruA [Flavobacteriaceae bacterium]|nr:tRNA pseudouridine(38-40) synthase TruA [Flavobacteriaceae bacterium]
MKYFLDLAYNGKNYCGWQNQPNALSVQEVVEKTLSTLLRQEISVVGAGRTDAGVHAKQLYAHFEVVPIEHLEEFQYRLNAFLPADIAVNAIRPVLENAHARFDATQREYEYHVTTTKDPFLVDVAYQVNHMPDLEIMNLAASELLNYKDFQCFSRSKTDVKTYHCDIERANWEQRGDLLVFTIAADRFLRNMVRAIVGTLLDIGYKKTSLEEFRNIIDSKNRQNAGASAPAHGLFLTKVKYPKTTFID